ncbi:shikimate dehydrogenase family protein [Microbacterium memoriense]|uniref:Shikimate dehydrogenase n=1 Tax=Microbacterium memoriense TaxID=2978350 RepID=A0ABT2P7Z8_9MICO|nr:shikimate dehydrogenase [Microbacterium memoriense]MCT9000826.1 shikimate dehydrogenase [Microbacterium memoriense]
MPDRLAIPARASLEVWGDPIDHSLSPRVHTAAYTALGWAWSYGRRRVDEAGFTAELTEHASGLRGLSLTFPLKAAAFAAATTKDRTAEVTGAVNTLLLTSSGPRGFNTDVGGLVADLRAHGVDGVEHARIIGAGATATSALVALSDLGVERVEVVARRPEAVAALSAVGERVGVAVSMWSADGGAPASVPVTISTLPGGAALPDEHAHAFAASGGLLYDVVYGHWPTALAAAWERVGHTAINGLGMLLHQAVLQIRIFATGNPDEPLPDEPSVVAVMRRALMGD